MSNQSGNPVYSKIIVWSGLFLTAIFYLMLRFLAVPNLWGTKLTPLLLDQAVGTRLALVIKWLVILISPFKPNFSDAVPIEGLLSPEALISIAVIILCLIIIIKNKISSDIGKSILLLVILLAPGLDIVPVPRVGSPHYAYLPSIAIAALSVTFIAAVNKNFQRIAFLIVAVWIITASVTTFASGFQFKNDLTLFTPEVTFNQDFIEGYYYLGNFYLKQGNLEQAAANYEMGLLDRPNILAFRARRWIVMNLAGVKLQQNKYIEANNLYDEALVDVDVTLKPYLIFNQALTAFKMENHAKVIDLLQNLTWDRPEAYLLLAKSYHAQGQLAEEIVTLKRALPYLNEPEKGEVEAVIKKFNR